MGDSIGIVAVVIPLALLAVGLVGWRVRREWRALRDAEKRGKICW